MSNSKFRWSAVRSVLAAIAIVIAVGAGIALLTLSPAPASAAAAPQLSSHLVIESASITELEPFDNLTVVGRPVRLEIVLGATPACTVSTFDLRFGFFIDSDKSSSTGLTDSALNDLGVDAKIEVLCNSSTQTYQSSVGTVTVATDGGTGKTTVQIDTTVDQLPSVDFHWIAYAFDNAEMGRLPDAGEHGHWATFEITLP